MNNLNDICYIDGKAFLLSDIEAMGFDNFGLNAHITPYVSVFKYYPNTKVYVKSEKKYHNYSFEALMNNTVFLQDARNFDDCFDCAVDLDWDKFLESRVFAYCRYFDVKLSSDTKIQDRIFALGKKLYEYGMVEGAIQAIHATDLLQKRSAEVFVRYIYIALVLEHKQWHEAVLGAIKNEYDEFMSSLSKFRISCFSTSPYLNRMWSSAYANNNQGFCLEYAVDLSTQQGNDLYMNMYPVIYSQTRNDLQQLSEHCDTSLTKDDLWQLYFNGLLRKSLHWIDQQEWRLIMVEGLIPQNPLPFFKIKKVYLGNKMPQKERIKIINYCRKHSIEYIGLIRDKNSFNLIECSDDCYMCSKGNNAKL